LSAGASSRRPPRGAACSTRPSATSPRRPGWPSIPGSPSSPSSWRSTCWETDCAMPSTRGTIDAHAMHHDPRRSSPMSSIWTKPISGPKAWRGDTLGRDTSSGLVSRTPDEIADIDGALATAKASGRPLEDIGREQFPLTIARARLEQTVAELYDGRGFVVLRGLPVERYEDDNVGLIFWGLGRYMGSPLHQHPQGDLLGHVAGPGRTSGNIDVRGYETSAYLPYHTDAGDVVGLLCLRRALEGGLSSIVSSVTVHNEILAHRPEYLGLLYNGFYYIRREAALTERGVSDRPIPVFGNAGEVVSCRYIRSQINRGAAKRGGARTQGGAGGAGLSGRAGAAAGRAAGHGLGCGRYRVREQLPGPSLADRIHGRRRAP